MTIWVISHQTIPALNKVPISKWNFLEVGKYQNCFIWFNKQTIYFWYIVALIDDWVLPPNFHLSSFPCSPLSLQSLERSRLQWLAMNSTSRKNLPEGKYVRYVRWKKKKQRTCSTTPEVPEPGPLHAPHLQHQKSRWWNNNMHENRTQHGLESRKRCPTD